MCSKKCRSFGESLITGAMLLLLVVLFLLRPCSIQAKIPAEGEWPEVQVIDMHTHVFNARDLPLVGILNALGAPRPVAVVVAEAILGSMPEEEGETRGQFSLVQVERPAVQPLSEPQRNVLLDYVGKDRVAPLTATAAQLDVQPDVTLLAETLAKIGFPPQEHPDETVQVQKMVNAADLGEALKGYVRFLGVMTKGHGEIVAALKTSYPEADLFVHHMMDMAVAYDDTPGIPFADQNVAMQKLDAAHPEKPALLHFTAFDPFRRDMALGLVKKAKDHSAIGMKIYPPSGYRAADNAIHKFPEKPKWLPDFFGRKRWNSRYAGWTEKALDDKLQEAFAWAVAENFPIFTHCTPWGFQAVRGYGMMADPFFWSSVLTRKENKGLRLAFGHAGGDPYWLSDPKDDEVNKKKPHQDEWQFGAQIVELCLTYPDVYCDLGYLDGILDPGKTGQLVQRLQSVVNRRSKDGKWRFGDKIMYGTDWHMMYKEPSYDKYLKGWDNVIKQLVDEQGTKGAWRQAFFARNARNFLQLEKLAKDRRFEPDQKKELSRLSDALK